MIIAATNHDIHVYPEVAFVNLEQTNLTTWVADSVDESKIIAHFRSSGNARIDTKTQEVESVQGIPSVKTIYGELVGIPSIDPDEDVLIVSLPTQSMAKLANHPLAKAMASPFKVVRLRSNTSTVLGCMGLSFQ